jgi:hypothetical protein
MAEKITHWNLVPVLRTVLFCEHSSLLCACKESSVPFVYQAVNTIRTILVSIN